MLTKVIKYLKTNNYIVNKQLNDKERVEAALSDLKVREIVS